jgi:hypothetical protein
MIPGFVPQDTIKPSLVIRINTDNLIPDSVFRRLDEVPDHIRAESARLRKKITTASPEIIVTDTTSVCSRNSIADVTFYDSLSFIRTLKESQPVLFPFHFTEKTSSLGRDQQLTIIKNLKDGEILPERVLHHDWIIAVIFLSAYLWLMLRSTTRSMFTELTRFLLLRGINESSSRNIGSLFTWQSTILNFVSFMGIGLFCYCAAEWYEFIPSGISPFLFMLISLLLVIFGITSRHLICIAAGKLSGEYEIFNEYLITVYKSYRFSSVLLFAIVVLLVYSAFLPVQVYFVLGLITLIFFYIYRVSRLFLIFIKRNISILYLILYLCALEILPVLILVKYFTGLNL